MKIKPGADVPSDFNKRINQAATGGSSRPAGEAGEVGAAAGARNFASVLDQVSRPREEDGGERSGGEERPESAAAEPQHQARRRDEAQDQAGAGPGMENPIVRQVSSEGEAAPAHLILQTADLDKIVITVRTQLAPGGQREVTLQLPHSVLEGLRVKLSAGESGRVTAEFFASSEGVKAQLDARAAELSDLLRARGVHLAKFSASVGADASGLANSGQGRGTDGRAAAGPAGRARGSSPAGSPVETEGEAGPPSDKVYRA